MYFLTFEFNGLEKIGILNKAMSEVIPIENIIEKDTPATIVELIKGFTKDNMKNIKQKLDYLEGIDIKDIKIKAPIPIPIRNVICVGKNYKEHVEELANKIDSTGEIPEYPIYFTKMIDRLVGPEEYIQSHSEITSSLDYEVELGIVIGKEGKNIPYDKVEEYIFGYTIINDVSVRDYQKRHRQWLKGKSFDGTCPMGPYIVHKSEISYPPTLDIKCSINGEIRQNSNTKNFIFDIGTLISDLSRGTTLKPGDIIATGTPSGVGMGFNPPRFLSPGDVVECYIEKIGTLRNIVD
jgi:2-keto-4-pentenoate hydratase/2-oxohepta-3-ene-1,7-dioic acid hydratase in catechol pathway